MKNKKSDTCFRDFEHLTFSEFFSTSSKIAISCIFMVFLKSETYIK